MEEYVIINEIRGVEHRFASRYNAELMIQFITSHYDYEGINYRIEFVENECYIKAPKTYQELLIEKINQLSNEVKSLKGER